MTGLNLSKPAYPLTGAKVSDVKPMFGLCFPELFHKCSHWGYMQDDMLLVRPLDWRHLWLRDGGMALAHGMGGGAADPSKTRAKRVLQKLFPGKHIAFDGLHTPLLVKRCLMEELEALLNSTYICKPARSP